MRTKFGTFALLLLLSSGLAGCLAVSAKNNRVGTDWAAVAVNDRIYLVNVTNGKMKRVEIPAHVPTVNATRVEVHISD